MNLGFTRFRLAKGASLYLYDAKDPHNGTRAYTDRDNEEHGQLWTYKAWAEWMDAADWAELRANHSPAPTGSI